MALPTFGVVLSRRSRWDVVLVVTICHEVVHATGPVETHLVVVRAVSVSLCLCLLCLLPVAGGVCAVERNSTHAQRSWIAVGEVTARLYDFKTAQIAIPLRNPQCVRFV
jgi:hypothetical protein